MSMQEYPVKRTHIKELPTNITGKLREHFECEPVESNGYYEISFGAIELMQVKLGAAGKSLIVGTSSRKDLEDETIILDTNRRFRRYLDDVTGYSTKDRVKKAKAVE